MSEIINRGDMYYADLNPVRGSEQGGVRPVLVIQNNRGNRYSPTVIVAAMSGRVVGKTHLPTHCKVRAQGALREELDYSQESGHIFVKNFSESRNLVLLPV